jgi:hypothetical protein
MIDSKGSVVTGDQGAQGRLAGVVVPDRGGPGQDALEDPNQQRRWPSTRRLAGTSFHQVLLGRSGAQWLDDPPDLACQDSTRQHALDGWRLSCKQQVGGSSPSASSLLRLP